MKYRMLTDDELAALEEDLKHFLVVNGVDNDAWVEMNKSDKDKAFRLVELFSDTVLQKVYEKIKFLEFRAINSCMVFKLGNDQIELISINTKEGSQVDLSTPESIHNALVNRPKELAFFTSNKGYSKVRESEIHEMVEQGCVPSSEAFWMSLEKVI